MTQVKQNIEALLARNQIAQAIDELRVLSEYEQEAVLLAQRLAEIEEQRRQQLITNEEASVGINIITKDILALLHGGAFSHQDQSISLHNRPPDNPYHLKQVVTHLWNTLDTIAPNFSLKVKSDELDELLVQAIANTIPLSVEFAQIVEHIAETHNDKAAKQINKHFETLLQKYYTQPGFQGYFRLTDFDFYKFIGHELFVIFISFLIRENRWETIASLLEEDFYIPPHIKSFRYLSSKVKLLEDRSLRLKLHAKSFHASLLNERHVQPPLANIVPMQQFMDADFFLFLRDEKWQAWSVMCLENIPRFLLEARHISHAEQLFRPLVINDISTLRKRINERRAALHRWDWPVEDYPLGQYDLQNIGSR